MKQPKTWFLVTDGAKARIVRDLKIRPGTGERLEDLVLEVQHNRRQEIMADRPGRSFSSHDARRSAMEYRSDPVREQQQGFAAKLIEDLEGHRKGEAFDRLVIIAAPRMLGLLREAMPGSLKSVVVGEFAKDLANLPENKLHDTLANLEF